MKYFLLLALLLVGCSVSPPDPKPTTGTPPVARRTPLPPPRPVSIPASVGLSESRFACDLWRAKGGKPEVDLIILNQASSILRFEALQGRSLYCRDPEKRAEFASLAAREYEDDMALCQRKLAAWRERNGQI